MSFEKVVIQQNQQDGSYLELYPKSDSFTKKETLLPTTSASYDLPESSVPDDIFQNIRARLNLIGSGQAYLLLTLIDNNNKKLSGVKVSGFVNGDVYSDDNGVAKGYISVDNSTLKVTGYADIEDASKTIAAKSGEFLTETFVLTTRNFLKILSSANYMFSPNVQNVDVSVGAAGGAGAKGVCGRNNATGGTGGGAGKVSVQTSISVIFNQIYMATVGAGTTGKGGDSSFLDVTAVGGLVGQGGKGAYASGTTFDYDGTDGNDGTQSLFSSMTDTALYGGDGGGGSAEYNSYTFHGSGKGGSPGGGNGGSGEEGSNGVNGLGGGGGGGGAYNWSDKDREYNYDGGQGRSGVIAIRMHLKNT